MLRRFFARLFGRRAKSPIPSSRGDSPATPTFSPSAVAKPVPPPPPPPPPPGPLPETAKEIEPEPAPLEGVPAAGHVRLVLSDGTVVEPPVDEDFEERLRYLSENVLKRRDRPST